MNDNASYKLAFQIQKDNDNHTWVDNYKSIVYKFYFKIIIFYFSQIFILQFFFNYFIEWN